MNVQTLTKQKNPNLVLRQRPSNDPVNNEKVGTIRDTGSVGEDCTEDAAKSQNEKATNTNPTMTDKNITKSKTKGGSGHIVSNRDMEKVLRSEPPEPERVERENIPCLPPKPQDCQPNVRQVKRNKNEHQGTMACQSANSTGDAKVDLLTSQMSELEIDGLEVDSPEGNLPISTNSIPLGTTSSSSVSMASLTSSAGSPVDELEYGDFSASSMPSSCSQPSLNNSTCTKDDFVILHTEEDEEDAYDYKKHLESDIGIPDIKVQLFSCFEYGQSDFNSLSRLGDSFHHVLVYATANLCTCSYTKYLNETTMRSNLKRSSNSKVTPVWTKKELPLILELESLPGLPFWRFKNNSVPELYVDKVKSLVKQARS